MRSIRSVVAALLVVCSALCSSLTAAEEENHDHILDDLKQYYAGISGYEMAFHECHMAVNVVANGELDSKNDLMSFHAAHRSFEIVQQKLLIRTHITEKIYSFGILARTNESKFYYDGARSVVLFPDSRTGIVRLNGRPSLQPVNNPLANAAGLIIPGTFHSSLGDVFEERNRVTVVREGEAQNGEYLITVKGMPASIRPKNIATPEDMMLKIWCQTSPKIHVTAWATYLKMAKAHVPTGDELIDKIEGGTGAPDFDLDGYQTYQAYKNVSLIEVVNHADNSTCLFPNKSYVGNAAGCLVINATAIKLNPNINQAEFTAKIPVGYHITEAN